jgi:hypothetical protein
MSLTCHSGAGALTAIITRAVSEYIVDRPRAVEVHRLTASIDQLNALLFQIVLVVTWIRSVIQWFVDHRFHFLAILVTLVAIKSKWVRRTHLK